MRVIADVLIGADGIHSTVQRLLFGATPPHFTGCAAYRGLVTAEKVAHLDLEVVHQDHDGTRWPFRELFCRPRAVGQFRGHC